MPGALFRDIINRVRHNSEKSDSGSSRKVSFNKAVKVKQISDRRRTKEPAERGKSHPRFNARNEGEEKAVETPETPRRRRHLSADSATDQANMYGPKAYGMGYNLHPSQQPWDPPRVKRNLVRNIVDKFNEEAKRRERLKHFENDVDDYQYGRPTSPGLIEATPDTAPNHNVPFSYTNGVPPSFLYKKSKSEHDLKATAQDGEVIYAQVVVNGHATNGVANKTTVHTKVPKKQTNTNNNSLTKNQSVSLGNLHSSLYNGHYESNGDINTRTMTQKKFASDEHYSRSGAHSSTAHRTKERRVKDSRSTTPLKEKRRDKWEGNHSKEIMYDNVDGSGKERKKREPSPDYKTETTKSRAQRNESPAFREKKRDSSEHKMKALIREPSPDYNGKNLAEESTSSSSKFKERRDFDHGFEEVEQSNNSWSTRRFLNGVSDGNSSSPTSGFVNGNSDNGFTSGGSSSNNFGKYKHTERETREEHRTTTRRHVHSSSSSSPTRDSAITNYSERKSKGSKQKNANELQNGNSKTVNGHNNEAEKKFYYFGANCSGFKGQHRSASADKVKGKESALHSTKLVKEANERVNGFSRQEQRNHVTSSHKKTEIQHQRRHHQEGRSSSADRTVSSKSKGMNGRIINIEVENAGKTSQIKQQTDTSAFGEDERMETSESDEMHPQTHSTPTRMREYSGSQDSGASNHWSSDEEIVLEDDDEIIAAHINTPSSMVREMGKQEISYENRQKSQEKSYSGQQMWFERTDVDSDYRKEMSTGSVGEYGTLRNDSNNNYSNSSATLSRLETQRNKINNDVTMRSATVDRRQTKKKEASEADSNQRTSTAVKILLNGRDVSDSELMSGNSRYLSETESQHSGRSKGSRKSAGSSPVSKRVNFKTRSKAKRSASSAANLSPVHREILLRTASPARAPSVTGSINSSGSEASHASNRSVILHATAVADIPAAKSYRYRIYRDSSPSPSPGKGNNKTVTRSFSLLGPFKPKKYKERYERRYESHHTPPHHRSVQTLPSALKRGQSADRLQTNDSINSDPTGPGSNNSSAERLDSLSPLPSDGSSPQRKKTVSVTRSHSMPKDTRFGGLFRKKKENGT